MVGIFYGEWEPPMVGIVYWEWEPLIVGIVYGEWGCSEKPGLEKYGHFSIVRMRTSCT